MRADDSSRTDSSELGKRSGIGRARGFRSRCLCTGRSPYRRGTTDAFCLRVWRSSSPPRGIHLGSTRWLARAPPASGSLLAPEALCDPDGRQLSRSNLLPSRNAAQPVERLRIERDRKGLGWGPPQTNVDPCSRVEQPCPLFITEVVPLTGLFAKGPSLRCG